MDVRRSANQALPCPASGVEHLHAQLEHTYLPSRSLPESEMLHTSDVYSLLRMQAMPPLIAAPPPTHPLLLRRA